MTTAPRKKNPEIPDSLLRELKENVALRNVSKGIALLEAYWFFEQLIVIKEGVLHPLHLR